MKSIDLILTYEDGPQDFTVVDFDHEAMESPETLVEFIKNEAEVREGLVKISMCAYGISLDDLPKWYLDWNGKIYFNCGEIDY